MNKLFRKNCGNCRFNYCDGCIKWKCRGHNEWEPYDVPQVEVSAEIGDGSFKIEGKFDGRCYWPLDRIMDNIVDDIRHERRMRMKIIMNKYEKENKHDTNRI
jgi:hypothetical protein